MKKDSFKTHDKSNCKESIFTIRSFEVTNKTIDSFSDIDSFTNSKNMSNFNMSNIFDNVAKEKSLTNPFTFKTILEEAGQDSILERSISAFKKKNHDEKPLKRNPNLLENQKKEENHRYEKLDSEEKQAKLPSTFDKIRSITPKIERTKVPNMPGSTRSITPLEREYGRPNEKQEKIPDNQTNSYQNRIFSEINPNTEKKKQSAHYEFINSKLNSIRNDNNKENLLEKDDNILKKQKKEEANVKFYSNNNNNGKVSNKETNNNNNNSNKHQKQKSDKIFDEYTLSLEEDIGRKNEEIYRLKQLCLSLEQENIGLKDQHKKIAKEKNSSEDDLKKKLTKLKGEFIDIEQKNYLMLKELKEMKKENDEKSHMIKELFSELNDNNRKTNERKLIYPEDDSLSSNSNPDDSFLKNRFLKEKKQTSKKSLETTNPTEKFANIFKNFSDFNDPTSIKKPPIESNPIFSTKNSNPQYNSNNKKRENDTSSKILEILQKNNYSKDLGAVKTTPDNLSSKRNGKGHISPIDFPSSRNKPETPYNYHSKNTHPLDCFNNPNPLSEERYRAPLTNQHKYKENPLFSVKNEEKNVGKKVLCNLLQERNQDINDYSSRNQINNYKQSHTKNESSSNSSYHSYLQKKEDNMFIQSSPRKFNRNLNEVIIDITKRCQTSSNSNIQKGDNRSKEKSLERQHVNIIDLKNKHKDPILPKPRGVTGQANENKQLGYFNENKQQTYFNENKQQGYFNENKQQGSLNENKQQGNLNEKNGQNINENKHSYLLGQNRRSSLNFENENSKKSVVGVKLGGEALNSSKKERSRSILSEKYGLQDD